MRLKLRHTVGLIEQIEKKTHCAPYDLSKKNSLTNIILVFKDLHNEIEFNQVLVP